MINVKKEIYALLKNICSNSFEIYPKNFNTFPVIAYTEEENAGAVYCDGEERLSNFTYKIDIWSKESNSELAAEIDAAMTKAGFRRTNCNDVEEADTRHKVMRYKASVDTRTLTTYERH